MVGLWKRLVFACGPGLKCQFNKRIHAYLLWVIRCCEIEPYRTTRIPASVVCDLE